MSMDTSPTADQPTDEELRAAFEQHIDRSIAASMPVVEASMIIANDLREKIIRELWIWRAAIRGEAHELGTSQSPSADVVADRILALLPKMPELRWGDCEDDEGFVYPVLYLNDLPVGHIHGIHGQWIAWLDSDDENPVTNGVTEQEARAAVEAAVRKALGLAENE